MAGGTDAGVDKEDLLDDLADVVEGQDVDALRAACSEARKTLDHQINTINEVDEKASSLVRYNLIFVGLLLTGLSIIAPRHPGFQSWVVDAPVVGEVDLQAALVLGAVISLGLVTYGGYLVFVSMRKAMDAYESTNMHVGPRSLLSDVTEHELDEVEWLFLLLSNYPTWIEENDEVNQADSELVGESQDHFRRGLVFFFAAGILYAALVLLSTFQNVGG